MNVDIVVFIVFALNNLTGEVAVETQIAPSYEECVAAVDAFEREEARQRAADNLPFNIQFEAGCFVVTLPVDLQA